ncbi:type II 3-dehydroquinate dehydratase [Nocardioides sambongensis]|uniref:type II 3-dehydroquinate dehydratase n=1 Tax=Nocardioides sambongensis TaxID=2589074 RepID=UPI0011279BC1|nr:type II 3-dehydroquinate dehydratase [Nocardioides sambongensis]
MTTVHVLNGPNLNLLGRREPAVYGRHTLADVEQRCRTVGAELGLEVDFRQSNHEGELVTWLQECGAAVAAGRSVGAVLNAGAYTHTSLALRDAVAGAEVPMVEVHLTNVHAREEVRHHSFLSPVARGVIVGLGVPGYELAIRALAGLAAEAGA